MSAGGRRRRGQQCKEFRRAGAVKSQISSWRRSSTKGVGATLIGDEIVGACCGDRGSGGTGTGAGVRYEEEQSWVHASESRCSARKCGEGTEMGEEHPVF